MPGVAPSSLSAVAGWLLFAALGAAVVRAERGGRPLAPWVLWGLASAGLLAFRWPLLQLAAEIYPDESQLLAGAITLRHDPLFWRSVDGGTAGPVDYFLLWPATFLPGAAAFAGARWIAALLTVGILAATGEAAAALTGSARARLAALPALAAAAFTTSPEFVHYSTELAPVFLLATGLAAAAWHQRRPAARTAVAAGLLLGLVPLAKLQVAPVALLVGSLLVAAELRAGRRGLAGLAVLAALAPAVATGAILAAAGEWENMFQPYVRQNLLYAATGRMPVPAVAALLWEQSVTNGHHALWLAGSALAWLAGLGALRRADAAGRGRVALAGGFLVLTLACVLAPGRPYHHYLHLLLPAVVLLTGCLLALPGARPGLLLGLALFPLLLLLLSPRADPYAGYLADCAHPPPARRELAQFVSRHSRPGDTLGVWGWSQSIYVETGLPQATCQAHIESLLVAGPSQPYYLRRYFEKVAANAPAVFLDTVGPADFRFHDRRFGHEVFPRLRTWLAEHYVPGGEIGGVRVFIRRDRAAAP